MESFVRMVVVGVALVAGAPAALAAASNMPTNYQPDPALKTASMGELRARVRQACAVVQARMQQVSEDTVSGKCGCYATRTMRTLSRDEVQAYRDTGVFDAGARQKALEALDICGLQRPAL